MDPAELLAAAKDAPRRCRMVERSDGPWLTRKFGKVRYFGLRYLVWAAARYGVWRPREVDLKLFWRRRVRLPFSLDSDFVTFYLAGCVGGPEYKLVRYLIHTLRENDVFYDVGASYGFYTYLAQELLPQGQIHAFEPLRSLTGFIERNCAGDKRVRVVNKALWREEGTSDLYLHRLSSVFSSLERELTEMDPGRGREKISVQTTTLDAYAGSHPPPTVVKLDVEGAESAVVDGGARTLRERAPTLAMEVWGGDGGKRFSLPCIKKLTELGYKPFILEEDGSAKGASLEEIERFLATIAWDNIILRKT